MISIGNEIAILRGERIRRVLFTLPKKYIQVNSKPFEMWHLKL